MESASLRMRTQELAEQIRKGKLAIEAATKLEDWRQVQQLARKLEFVEAELTSSSRQLAKTNIVGRVRVQG